MFRDLQCRAAQASARWNAALTLIERYVEGPGAGPGPWPDIGPYIKLTLNSLGI